MAGLKLLGIFDDSAPPQAVPASGNLAITVRVPNDQYWKVTQISAKMASVPSGATLELQKIGQFVAKGFSARHATFDGSPPLEVRGGEYFACVWTGATPGVIGNVFYMYEKHVYA